jgi:hypothetical protein
MANDFMQVLLQVISIFLHHTCKYVNVCYPWLMCIVLLGFFDVFSL